MNDRTATEQALARYEKARNAYLAALFVRPTWPAVIGQWLHGARYHLRALAMFALTTLLCLMVARCSASEVPAWVLRGIAAVETRTTWRDIGDLHYRDKRIGADGEVGPWQLSPAALKDLGVEHLRARIHREPILAESMTRAWLLRCHRRTGDWFEAVAIYHTGPDGNRRRGHTYAARVRAVGITTN